MTTIPANKKKIDIYQFDLDKVNGDSIREVSDLITWGNVRIRLMKNELKGLADFINKFLENDQ